MICYVMSGKANEAAGCVLHPGEQISLCMYFMGSMYELQIASDCMHVSEESHSLLFFFMPFPKELQRGQLGPGPAP